MLLSGQTAIVTGSSRGIGKAIVYALAKEGASLIINGTNVKLLTELADDIEKGGGNCIPIIGDISDPNTSKVLIEKALEHFGGIHILVNNAGIIFRTSSEEMKLEEWDRTFQVNLVGTLQMCLAVLPYMKQQNGGKIVNIVSSAAKKPHPNSAPSYGASKAGMLYLTRHLAIEMGPYGIHVNAICPGPIDTDMSGQWTEDYRQKIISTIPLGRLGKPDDIAKAVLFLSSSMSDFITGEAINVNGGTIMD